MPTSKEVQMRRGTTLENNAFTGAEGEVTVDTTLKTLRVHDNATVGGTEIALADLANVPEDTDFETRVLQRVAEMIQNGGEVSPVGDIKASFVDLGSDYLPADGRTLLKSAYPDLYELVGDQYNANGVGATSYAAFTLSNVPQNNFSNVAFKGNTAVFVITGSNYLLTSTNGGISWSAFKMANSTYSKAHVVNDKFVVAISGTTYSSTDGITWTTSTNTMTGTGATNAATFSANGMMLSADTAAPTKFAYSTDGITFSSYVAAPATATTGYFDLFYSSRLGLYFLSTNNGKILSSPDLINWTLRQSTSTSSVLNMTFAENGGTIIAVGGTSSAQISYSSTDGITWTARNTGTARVYDVKWASAASVFVAAAAAGLVSTSPDGTTWTIQTLANTGAVSTINWTNLAVSSNGISLYGFNTANNQGAAMSAGPGSSTFNIRNVTSATGRGWNRAAYCPGNDLTWLWGDGTLTLYNNISTTNTNGASFRTRWSGVINFSSTSSAHVASLDVNGNSEVVMALSSVSSNSQYYPATIHYTNQGDNFAFSYCGVGGIRKLRTIDNKIFVVGITGMVSYTTDGVTWNVNDSVGDGNSHIMDIAYNGTTWVVVCHDGKTFSSNDLTTWTERGTYLTTTTSDILSRTIIWTGTHWVVSNSTTSIAYTNNLDTWTVNVFGIAVTDLKFGNGTVVAMTATATYASTNLTAWTSSATQSGTNVNQTISFGNGVFLIGGGDTNSTTATTNAIVNVSFDGVSWTKVDLGVKGYVKDISFGNSIFTLITNNGSATGTIAGGSMYNSTNGYLWNTAFQSTASTHILQKVSTTSGLGAHATGTGGGAAYSAMPSTTVFRLPNIAPSGTEGTFYIKVNDN